MVVQADADPRNCLERLALDIFEAHTGGARFNRAKSGAEWWTQVWVSVFLVCLSVCLSSSSFWCDEITACKSKLKFNLNQNTAVYKSTACVENERGLMHKKYKVLVQNEFGRFLSGVCQSQEVPVVGAPPAHE